MIRRFAAITLLTGIFHVLTGNDRPIYRTLSILRYTDVVDMNFAPFNNASPAGNAVTLADILAAAQAHRIVIAPAATTHIGDLRGQDETPDCVNILARLVASSSCGMIDAANLEGSFNPIVAQQLMVGKRR
jgi:hypothetical protein